MTAGIMEIWGFDGAKSPIFELDGGLEEALAAYCAHRWPVGRRKAVEREWDLSVDEAKAVVERRASKRILNKIWSHPRGGWAVALPVMAGVIGQPIDAFFRDQLNKSAREAARAAEHRDLAATAYRALAGRPDRDGSSRDSAQATGETRSFTRKVGASAARRLAGR